jgi:hypothetical protein
MRVHRFILAAALALFGMHCSSEEPARDGVTENRPGALVITKPARASFIEGTDGKVEIEGTGATPALTINGARAKVEADGSFHASMRPSAGLNLVVAVDGESRLETPFLYGHFASPETPVPEAVALDIGSIGIGGAPPAASLSSVTNLALADRDLIALIRNQTFDGTILGAKWTFKVNGGSHAKPNVALSTAVRGIAVNASIANVTVDGTLSLALGGKDYARDVHIIVDRATVLGEAELTLDREKGALRASLPKADAKLEGFRYDADNIGLPCCVDAIVSTVLQPKIEETIRDAMKSQIPQALELTLDGIGLPKQLDLSSLGLQKPLAIQSRFDSATFDPSGGTITASVLFGGKFDPGTPGEKAPGWLKLGELRGNVSRTPSLGISFAVDAINQLLFAAWGTGALAFTTPEGALQVKLSPALPPVLSLTENGALRAGLGEVLVQRLPDTKPMAAVSILQDILPGSDGQNIVLKPEGEPTLSITWLGDDTDASIKNLNLIAVAAKDQIGKFLKPMTLPVPKIGLEQLGPGFAGQSVAIQTPNVAVDRRTARVGVSGAMTIAKP